MTVLALLNLGTSEILLLLVLMVLLFGVDRLPQLARSLGRAKAQFDGARRQLSLEMETEKERQLREQLSFERQREQQVASQQSGGGHVAPPEPTPEEEAALRQAAEALGVPSAGRTIEELRVAIARKVEPPR